MAALFIILFISATGQASDSKTETSDIGKNTGKTNSVEKIDWSVKLEEGRNLVAKKEGNALEAISCFFNPIIEHFEATYNDSTNKIYCASDPSTTLIYLMSSAMRSAVDEADVPITNSLPFSLGDDTRGTVVIKPTWAEAYYLKAYALIELGHPEKAKAELKHALDLSPLNAIYWAELGHVLQLEKKWIKCMKAFRKSEEASKFSSDDRKNLDLARAWRGIGFCLTEMGKLDESEQMYKKCLELDEKDKMALNELDYIQQLKKKRSH